MNLKMKLIVAGLLLAAITGGGFYLRYFFSYDQRQRIKRSVDSVTGQNLTVTVFGFDGKIIKRWVGIPKITSGYSREGSVLLRYSYFYTREGKYVQIPDSVWYIAEEE